MINFTGNDIHRINIKHIENGEMALNVFRQIAGDVWLKLPERFPNFELDAFQIMPNHMHGIILLNDVPVGAGFTPAPNALNAQNAKNAPNGLIAQSDAHQDNVNFPGFPPGTAAESPE